MLPSSSLRKGRKQAGVRFLRVPVAAAQEKDCWGWMWLVLDAARIKLGDADPESVEERLGNCRLATKRAMGELQANRDRQNGLRSSLELRGEQGLQTSYDDAVNLLSHLEREYEGEEARAEAARVLRDTFAKHREQAHQRYIGPFKESIEQLGRIVFGSTFEVEIDRNLNIVRRTLDGVTLHVEQLSTGAREQLGVISRLACATIVSPEDGGAPVMIDDALGWSDPQRLQSMGARHCSCGQAVPGDRAYLYAGPLFPRGEWDGSFVVIGMAEPVFWAGGGPTGRDNTVFLRGLACRLRGGLLSNGLELFREVLVAPVCVHLTVPLQKLAAVHPEGRCDWLSCQGGRSGPKSYPTQAVRTSCWPVACGQLPRGLSCKVRDRSSHCGWSPGGPDLKMGLLRCPGRTLRRSRRRGSGQSHTGRALSVMAASSGLSVGRIRSATSAPSPAASPRV